MINKNTDSLNTIGECLKLIEYLASENRSLRNEISVLKHNNNTHTDTNPDNWTGGSTNQLNDTLNVDYRTCSMNGEVTNRFYD